MFVETFQLFLEHFVLFFSLKTPSIDRFEAKIFKGPRCSQNASFLLKLKTALRLRKIQNKNHMDRKNPRGSPFYSSGHQNILSSATPTHVHGE